MPDNILLQEEKNIKKHKHSLAIRLLFTFKNSLNVTKQSLVIHKHSYVFYFSFPFLSFIFANTHLLYIFRT